MTLCWYPMQGYFGCNEVQSNPKHPFQKGNHINVIMNTMAIKQKVYQCLSYPSQNEFNTIGGCAYATIPSAIPRA